MAETSAAAQATINKTLEERLDAVTKRLGDGLERSTVRTQKTIGDIQSRLAVIDAAQKNLTELAGQVVGLQDILANKQARGAFGEVQLEDLVRNILPPSAYEFQATLANGKRADCLIVVAAVLAAGLAALAVFLLSSCPTRRGRSWSTPSSRSRAITRCARRKTTPQNSPPDGPSARTS